MCFHVVSVVLYADKATRDKGRPLDIWVQQTSKIANTQAVRYWRQVEIEGMRTSTRLWGSSRLVGTSCGQHGDVNGLSQFTNE